MSKKPRKPRSPAAPSTALEKCFADAQKLYEKYGSAAVSRTEVASALELSSTSSGFERRIFSITAFGLFEAEGKNVKVSGLFQRLKAAKRGSSDFQKLAFEAAKRPRLFSELLSEFGGKLPPREAVATRLESQKGFNEKPAKEAARTLEESLSYAGLLDGSGNILPVREEPGPGATGLGKEGAAAEIAGYLSAEVPLGSGRKAHVVFPPDITKKEAQKIGNVLAGMADS